MTILDGYESDPTDVEALLAFALDDEDRADPTRLYLRATQMQALYLEAAAELKKARADAVAKLLADMGSHQKVADHLGLHKSRVGALLKDR